MNLTNVTYLCPNVRVRTLRKQQHFNINWTENNSLSPLSKVSPFSVSRLAPATAVLLAVVGSTPLLFSLFSASLVFSVVFLLVAAEVKRQRSLSGADLKLLE